MQHNDLAAEAITKWQAVKDFSKELEGLHRVLGLDLALKAVDAVHVERLVVAAREVHVVGVEHLTRSERAS